MNVIVTHVLGSAIGDAAVVEWDARARRDGGDVAHLNAQSLAEARVLVEPYPRLLAHIETVLAEDPSCASQESFDFGLEAILDGLAARLARVPA